MATFGGAVGNGSSSATSFFNLFTTDAGGTTQFAGNVVSSGIALNSDVELLGNVTFAGLGGAFNGSVDGGGFGVQLGFLETAVDGARWSNLASLRFEGGDIRLSNTITTKEINCLSCAESHFSGGESCLRSHDFYLNTKPKKKIEKS